MKPTTAAIASLLILTSCGSGGNLKSAKDYDVPPPPPIAHPAYNP